MVEILTVNLQASGYEVMVARDGLAGWQIFEAGKPDLVILDLQLPQISGFRLLELFRRSERPHVPVLALTALDFAEAEELTYHGLDGFITKPFQPADLLRTVQYLLNRAALSASQEVERDANDE